MAVVRLPFRQTWDTRVAANGTAAIEIGTSTYNEKWELKKVSVQLSDDSGSPEVLTYVDGNFTGGTYSGARDTDPDFGETLESQSKLRVVWTGATAGATATLTVTGYKVIGEQ